MVSKKHYYELLGIEVTATEDEVKKAYKKLALMYHPDRSAHSNVDENKFKEITNAYEILRDPQKRKIYDQFGPKAAAKNDVGGAGPGGMADFFNNFTGFNPFGPGGPFNAPFESAASSSSPNHAQRQKGKSVHYRLQASLEDFYRGKKVDINIKRAVICKCCQGHGGDPKQIVVCQACNGTGRTTVQVNAGPFMTQVFTNTCATCNGSKQHIPRSAICKTCNGKKTIQEIKRLHVVIERGMKAGDRIVFEEMADEIPVSGVTAGDLIVQVDMINHDFFQRWGNDLHCYVEVDLKTALCGGEIAIDHIDKRQVRIQLNPGDFTNTHVEKVMGKEGMPLQTAADKAGAGACDQSAQFGDLIVKLQVKFPQPSWFTEERINALKEIM